MIARKKLEDTVSALKELNSENKKRLQELEKELKAYKSVVETYVYPEIANELLAKEGAIRQTDEIIKADSLENDIITATTDIKKISKSRSNVIEGLFKLED